MTRERVYDVAVLGSGIGGTILASILARHGLQVLVVEKGSHPRFTIGESTIPETTILLRLMAKRYGVPEIGHLSNFNRIRAYVSTACGVKRNFSFVYHRDGEPNYPEHVTQFPTWAPPFGPDVHYYRQDVDAYMLAVAVSYGATARQQTDIQEIDFEPTGVRLRSIAGETFYTQFVVDAGGIQAPLARMFGLREEPCPLRTRSRSLFTHMVHVAPFDRNELSSRRPGLPSPICQGTLHHIFKGGWIWVIPFDNHPSSTNLLTSVGVVLDLSEHPKPSGCPEQEFRQIVSRFPSVRKQFEGARPVRSWVSSDRLQYFARSSVGDRFCLLPHAASFVDPLFSSGLAITMSAVNLLAARLIQAKRDGDYSAERIRFVDKWVQKSFEYYDRLVSCAYISFRDFELWNAWHRIWMLGSLYGVTGMFDILSRYERTGDSVCFNALETCPYRGIQAIDFDAYQHLFQAAAGEVEAVQDGRQTSGDGATRIYKLLTASGLAPGPWKLNRPERLCPGTFTLLPMMRLVAWGRYQSPQKVRRHYFLTGRAGGLVTDLFRTVWFEFHRACRAIGGVIRDALWSWNQDWRSTQGGSRTAVELSLQVDVGCDESREPKSSKPTTR